MSRQYKIVSVQITDVSWVVLRRRKTEIRTVTMIDISDGSEYKLVAYSGHRNAQRFAGLPKGTRLSGVVVFEKDGKWYADGNSNFSIIKANPLF